MNVSNAENYLKLKINEENIALGFVLEKARIENAMFVAKLSIGHYPKLVNIVLMNVAGKNQ